MENEQITPLLEPNKEVKRCPSRCSLCKGQGHNNTTCPQKYGQQAKPRRGRKQPPQERGPATTAGTTLTNKVDIGGDNAILSSGITYEGVRTLLEHVESDFDLFGV